MKLRNAKHEEAAQLSSEDRLTDQQIAEKVGISRQQLTRWKRGKAFAARVEQLTGIWSERALKYGLARRERRLAVLSDMHNRLLTIIDERGQDAGMQAIPGGKTGLVCRTLKGIGKGSDFQVVEVYECDTSILKELRGLQEQISKELGQYVEQVNITVGLAEQIAEGRQRVAAARNANLIEAPTPSETVQ
jgi:transcriptional regulator with XRE-family HTH domain